MAVLVNTAIERGQSIMNKGRMTAGPGAGSGAGAGAGAGAGTEAEANAPAAACTQLWVA